MTATRHLCVAHVQRKTDRQTGRETDRETYSLSGNRRGNHKSFKALIKFKIHAVKPQQQVAGGRRQAAATRARGNMQISL